MSATGLRRLRCDSLAIGFLAVGCLAVAGGAQGKPAPVPVPHVSAAPVDNPFLPFDRLAFEQALERLGADATQLQTFRSRIDEVGPARAGDDLVRSVAPALDTAIKRHETGDPQAAVDYAQVIATATEPVLQAHARYHLARLFLDSDDPEHAIDLLNEYFAQCTNHSPLDAEAAFFYAQALADVPLPEAAVDWYRAFLRHFPTASERFRSAAHQRAGEIARQLESRLHTLADGMKKTTRDLRRQQTDKPVQLDQEKYLEELDALIEEYQQRESQSSGSPSGTGPSSAPASNSALVDGDGSVGKLDKRPSAADRWIPMKDAEREVIEAKVQKGLPPQYQKMLEEYYKKLGKQPGKQ